MFRILVILIAIALSGCFKEERVDCDIFSGYAIVSGVVLDLGGQRMGSVDVEFGVAPKTTCDQRHNYFGSRGTTDSTGTYEVLLEGGNATGLWCVFGNVVGSDSVSAGQVEFVADCPTPTPRRTLELDLVYLPSN